MTLGAMAASSPKAVPPGLPACGRGVVDGAPTVARAGTGGTSPLAVRRVRTDDGRMAASTAAVRGRRTGTLVMTLLGMGAMASPRYRPAGLLVVCGGHRLAIDGGPGAEPPGRLD